MTRRASGVVAALAVGVLLLAGCSAEETPLPSPTKAAATTPAAPVDCENDASTVASYPPSTSGGPTLDEIRSRDNGQGRLVVGVSGDTYLMSSQAPGSLQLQGFDIDIAKAVARAIFGPDANLGERIQFKVITAADRIPDLQDGTVDMVVRNMTITCDRWEQVAFSAEYYHATQKMLFRDAGTAADYGSVSDLAGLRICAPAGSTSLTNISNDEPDAIITPAATHTGCLVKLQQGEVDAITGDDTVLAGLAAQDPYAVVPTDQPDLSEAERTYGEPYGVAVSKDAKDLAAFINAVLADLDRTGEWQRIYHRWLEPYLKVPATQPTPAYGRS
ncbi:glutamate ABC transporter substrate-binding protein [Nocardioides panacisoli]|uniref:Glutamate ABC transporter substrate-binding protein n=1 Tax=Nocardioides panacisoli TaxID=627624 RepID=A0ABP7I0W0_9ACTN